MLGRLLEISVSTSEPLAALQQYRSLGFHELTAGEVWSHPYAVIGDGDVCIGLHAYEFDSPSLTFVQSALDRWVEAYRVQQIDLAFEKLSPDEFNEIGFVDPGGQMVAVLESRTFSPPAFEGRALSVLGRLRSIELPCRDAAASAQFWAKLGREGDSGRIETADLTLELDTADALTLHYEGDPLEVAAAAARHGLPFVSISADESTATLRPPGGPVFTVSPA